MVFKKIRVTSGVDELDKLLDELYIGDNVVWHDDAGSLADVFFLKFYDRKKLEWPCQVAIDLSVKRGKTYLTILKAEKHNLDTLNRSFNYWSKDRRIFFDLEKRSTGQFDLGIRLKKFRTKRGLSQTELAKLVGVTPSTISQVESDLIYPSLPALLK